MIRGITEDILKRVYDFSEMTNEELRCKFFQKLQECIELCNNTNDILDWLKNEGLEKEVNELLTIWKDNGTLEELINSYIRNLMKAEIIAELKQELINQNTFSTKTFTNLPLNLNGRNIIDPKTSKSFVVSLPENIPQLSITSIYFSTTIEDGLIYDYKLVNENTLCIRFINVTDNSIALTDKEISLKAIY